jgi:hypothetical protein
MLNPKEDRTPFTVVVDLAGSDRMSWKELKIRIKKAIDETEGAGFLEIHQPGSPDRYLLKDPDVAPPGFK